MYKLSDEDFERIVATAIDAIPLRYAKHIDNVGFVIETEPTAEQRQRLHLVNGMTLYGLYEGIPLTRRGNNYSGVLPDKITIFKNPILATSLTEDDVAAQVKKTVWHEVAHYFGLDHDQIIALER